MSYLKKGQLINIFGNNYIIDQELGEGGFGKVFLIINDNVRFAMKTIVFDPSIQHFTKTAEYRALMNEFKLCITIDPHPNIVTFISFYKDKSNNIYAILEYIEDGNLLDLIWHGGIDDIKLVLDIAIDIASGLAYLHSHNIIHRDLNPVNILLEKSPFTDQEVTYLAKITDFGLSSARGLNGFTPEQDANGIDIIDDSDFVGNRNYVSPEQLNKSDSGLEKETDIFAFGMILCQMITGKLPFWQKDLIRDHDYDKSKKDLETKIFSFIKNNNKEIDDRIITLIIKCLHYYPHFRWKEERKNSDFQYFVSIRDELEKIRGSIFGTIRNIKLVFEGEYLLYQMKGVALLNLGDPENALDMLLKSLKINPHNINSLCNIGLAYKGLLQYDNSLFYLDKSLDDNKGDAEIYNYIGNVFSEKGYDSKYVTTCYKKALELDPNNYSAYYNMGQHYYDIEKSCKEAQGFYEKAYQLKKDDPILTFYLGVCYLEQENLDLSECFFNKTVQNSSESLDYYIRICEKLIEKEKWKLAKKFCDEGRQPRLYFSDSRLKQFENIIEKSFI